jgi:hypothetical protein
VTLKKFNSVMASNCYCCTDRSETIFISSVFCTHVPVACYELCFYAHLRLPGTSLLYCARFYIWDSPLAYIFKS